jgi:hypothetical protein
MNTPLANPAIRPLIFVPCIALFDCVGGGSPPPPLIANVSPGGNWHGTDQYGVGSKVSGYLAQTDKFYFLEC